MASKFYQRYLATMEKATGRSRAVTEVPAQVDATSMNPASNPNRKSVANRASTRVIRKANDAPIVGNAPPVVAPIRRDEVFSNPDTFSPDVQREIVVFEKSEASKKIIRDSLSQHYLFENLGVDDMEKIVNCMKPMIFKQRDVIICEGDVGDQFFFIESGEAVASVIGVGDVAKYTVGGCFGELALIYNSPRAASVVALGDVKTWVIDIKTFRYILASTSSSEMVRRCEFLKKCIFLDPLPNELIGKVAAALHSMAFVDGAYVIRQGDQGDSFFIIEEGKVRCTQVKANGREVELITLKPGDYFGEMALMLNETRHANCIASGPTQCLTLDRVSFDVLLGPVQELLIKRMRIRILQSVPLLAKLSDAKLIKLASVMRVQAFVDGQYIIRQGEEGSRFYIINEGEVQCTKTTADNKEEELMRLYPQEFFGERALITNEERKANVIAMGPVECLVLERSAFQTLLAEVQDDLVDEIKRRDGKNAEAEAPPVVEVIPTATTAYAYKEFKQMRTIGTGTFGRVKIVVHTPTTEVYAMKIMNKAEIVTSHQEKNVMAEKNLLFECSGCPFILKLMQTFNFQSQIVMVMEFVQGGELWSYIYDKTDTMARSVGGGFDMYGVRFYAANVILAFKYMHTRAIGYRDLKPENLLLDKFGYIKVIDFGFAKRFPYIKNGQKYDKTYTLCGTPEYLAPEIVMSKGYDKSVDYWALGCLVYELFLARTPFQADYTTKIFQNICASERSLVFSSKMEPSHVNLIKKLLVVNPVFRLGNLIGGVDDIIHDPFFDGFDWAAVENRTAKAPYVPPVNDQMDTSNFDEYDEDDNVPDYQGSQEFFDGF